MAPATVVSDMFVLMNFLRIDRMDLVGCHPSGFITTDHIGADIAKWHADQQVRYAAAIAAGHISQERVDHPAEVDMFARLVSARRLGVGECSAIAIALNRGYGLAADDPRPVSRALRDAGLSSNELHVVGTADIVSTSVQLGVLTLPAANAICAQWAFFDCCAWKPGSPRDLSE